MLYGIALGARKGRRSEPHSGNDRGNMSEVKRDYEIGYRKPPLGRPFQKGQSGNPRGPRRKTLAALLIAALNEPVYTTLDGHRRKITKREAIVTQMVNKS